MSDIRRIDPDLEPDTPPPPLSEKPKLAKSSFTVMIVTLMMGLLALGLAGYYFAGFAENDAALGALSSAFLFCFGVGALGYVPMFWIFRIARRVRIKGPNKRDVALVLALIVPWLALSISLTATRIPLIFVGIGLSIVCIFILTWAWAVFRNS